MASVAIVKQSSRRNDFSCSRLTAHVSRLFKKFENHDPSLTNTTSTNNTTYHTNTMHHTNGPIILIVKYNRPTYTNRPDWQLLLPHTTFAGPLWHRTQGVGENINPFIGDGKLVQSQADVTLCHDTGSLPSVCVDGWFILGAMTAHAPQVCSPTQPISLTQDRWGCKPAIKRPIILLLGYYLFYFY